MDSGFHQVIKILTIAIIIKLEIVFNCFNVSFFPEKIKTGYNAAIGTDMLHSATVEKLLSRTVKPCMQTFMENSQ